MYSITIYFALTTIINTKFEFRWDGNNLSHKSITEMWLDKVISDGCTNNIEGKQSILPFVKKIELEQTDFDQSDKRIPLITTPNDLADEILSYIDSERDGQEIDYTCTFRNIEKDIDALDDSQSAELELETRRLENIAELQNSFSNMGNFETPNDDNELENTINKKKLENNEIPIEYRHNPNRLNAQAMEILNEVVNNPSKYFPMDHITKQDLSDTNPSNEFDPDFRMTDPDTQKRRLKLSYKIVNKLKKIIVRKKIVFYVITSFIILSFIVYFWIKAIYIYYFQSIVNFNGYPEIQTTYESDKNVTGRDTSKIIITLSSEDEAEIDRKPTVVIMKPKLLMSSYDASTQSTVQANVGDRNFVV